eukprot:GHVN01002047.1.p1 GENE.GHVN01002047.1~~GHVN01002047.1.p1  ORF type:complete len:4463 (-),score=744.69 GHVN01002047.1:1187-14575(-)
MEPARDAWMESGDVDLAEIVPFSSLIEERKGSPITFPIPNFHKIAKTQTDIESPTKGECRGLTYRLLVHPRGTNGTESESSHISLFLEAVKQDWYPDDWVFPNVRFELTIHNFKDEKSSVTSWAHWSFSNDATSRGWQKMLNHSNLTRAKGFIDEGGGVLIKGKAEPPYPCLWSRTPRYRPPDMWALAHAPQPAHAMSPDDAQQALSHATQEVLQSCDFVVPAIQTCLCADYLTCFVQILYHLKEFRREIFLWNTPLSRSALPRNSGSKKPEEATSLIEGLQTLFAQMYLWPLVSSSMKWATPLDVNSQATPFLTSPPSPAQSKGSDQKPLDIQTQALKNAYTYAHYNQPHCKIIAKALGLHELDKMEHQESLVKIHAQFFWMLHQECHIAYVKHLCSQALMDQAEYVTNMGQSASEPQSSLNQSHDEESSDAQELDHTMRVLFSTESERPAGSDTGDPENRWEDYLSTGDYSTCFIKVKHLHSMSRALETCGKKLKRFPEVLFFYLHHQKHSKKGELFDVPIRLEASCLLSPNVPAPAGGIPPASESGPTTVQASPRGEEGASVNSMNARARNEQTRERGRRRRHLMKKWRQNLRQRKMQGPNKGLQSDTLEGDHSDLDSESETEQGLPADGTSCSLDATLEATPQPEVTNGSQADIGTRPNEKWYGLFSMAIRDGDPPSGRDGSAASGNSLASHYLIIRPEEDGHWYRLIDDRAERLEPEVDFNEWKCHRDFFCSVAVYMSEDYIDALAGKEVDLEGDLKELNPALYNRTLSEMGLRDEQLIHCLARAQQDISREGMTTEEAVSHEPHLSQVISGRIDEGKQTRKWGELIWKTAQHFVSSVPRINISPPMFPLVSVPPHPTLKHPPGQLLWGGSPQGATSQDVRCSPSVCDGSHHLRIRPQTVYGSGFNPIIPPEVQQHLPSALEGMPSSTSRQDVARGGTRKQPEVNRLFQSESSSEPPGAPAAPLGPASRRSGSTVASVCDQRSCLQFRSIGNAIRQMDSEAIKDTLCRMIFDKVSQHERDTKARRAQLEDQTKSEPQPSQAGQRKRTHEEQTYMQLLTRLDKHMHGKRTGSGDPEMEATYNQLLNRLDKHLSLLAEHAIQVKKDVDTYCEIRRTASAEPNRLRSLQTTHSHGSGDVSGGESDKGDHPRVSQGSPSPIPASPTSGGLRSDGRRRRARSGSQPSADGKERRRSATEGGGAGATGTSDNGDESSCQRRNDVGGKDGEPGINENLRRDQRATGSNFPRSSDSTTSSQGVKDSDQSGRILRENLAYDLTQIDSYVEGRLTEIWRSTLQPAYGSEGAYGTKQAVDQGDGGGEDAPHALASATSGSERPQLSEDDQPLSRKRGTKGATNPFSRTPKPTSSPRRGSESSDGEVKNSSSIFGNCGSDIADILVQAVTSVIENRTAAGWLYLCAGVDSEYCRPWGLGSQALISTPSESGCVTEEERRDELESCVHDVTPPSEPSGFPSDVSIPQAPCHGQAQQITSIGGGSHISEDFQLGLFQVDQLEAHKIDPDVFASINNACAYLRRDRDLSMFWTHYCGELAQIDGNKAQQWQMLAKAQHLPMPSRRAALDSILAAQKLYPGLDKDHPGYKSQGNQFCYISVHIGNDLMDLEGFGSEQMMPSKRHLVCRRRSSVSRLYGALRMMLMAQCNKEVKADEEKTPEKSDTPRSHHALSWLATPQDAILLYALLPDPISRGRHRFKYMSPDSDVDSYVDEKRKLNDADGADVTMLMQLFPEAILNDSGKKEKKIFPLTAAEESRYPLLIFKWYSERAVDLVCVGSRICDEKRKLEEYISEWVIPIARSRHYLPPANKDDPAMGVDVFEETHYRTVQRIRKHNALIKKINKKTGDVIIVQKKAPEEQSPKSGIQRLSDACLSPVTSAVSNMPAAGRKLFENLKAVVSNAPISGAGLPFAEAMTVGNVGAQRLSTGGSDGEAEVGGSPGKFGDGEGEAEVSGSADASSSVGPGVTVSGGGSKGKKKKSKLALAIPAKIKGKLKTQLDNERRRTRVEEEQGAEENDAAKIRRETMEKEKVEHEEKITIGDIIGKDISISPVDLVKTKDLEGKREEKAASENTTRTKGAVPGVGKSPLLGAVPKVAEPSVPEALSVTKAKGEGGLLASALSRPLDGKKAGVKSGGRGSPITIESPTSAGVVASFTRRVTPTSSAASAFRSSSSLALGGGQSGSMMAPHPSLLGELTGAVSVSDGSTPNSLPSNRLAPSWLKRWLTDAAPEKIPTELFNSTRVANAVNSITPGVRPFLLSYIVKCEREAVLTDAVDSDTISQWADPVGDGGVTTCAALSKALIDFSVWDVISSQSSSQASQTSARGVLPSQQPPDATAVALADSVGEAEKKKDRCEICAEAIETIVKTIVQDEKDRQFLVKLLQADLIGILEKSTIDSKDDVTTESQMMSITINDEPNTPDEGASYALKCSKPPAWKWDPCQFCLVLSVRQRAVVDLLVAIYHIPNNLLFSRKTLQSLTSRLLVESGLEKAQSFTAVCLLNLRLGLNAARMLDSQAGRKYVEQLTKKMCGLYTFLSQEMSPNNPFEVGSPNQLLSQLPNSITSRRELAIATCHCLVFLLRDMVTSKTALAVGIPREIEMVVRRHAGVHPQDSETAPTPRTGGGDQGQLKQEVPSTIGASDLTWAKTVAGAKPKQPVVGGRGTTMSVVLAGGHHRSHSSAMGALPSPSSTGTGRGVLRGVWGAGSGAQRLKASAGRGIGPSGESDDEDDDDVEDVELRRTTSTQASGGPGTRFDLTSNQRGGMGRGCNDIDSRGHHSRGRQQHQRQRKVRKDSPYVVKERQSWAVVYKPAFWHCSGNGADGNRGSVDSRLDMEALLDGNVEAGTQGVSFTELIQSGKSESFHLWVMKRFPREATMIKWNEFECGLCHRIDLETSGALLIAKTIMAREFIWNQFRKREVRKEYLMLCHGRMELKKGEITKNIKTLDLDSKARQYKSHYSTVVEDNEGDQAFTEYTVCRVYKRKKWNDVVKTLLSSPQKVGDFATPSIRDMNRFNRHAPLLEELEKTRNKGNSPVSSCRSRSTSRESAASEHSTAATHEHVRNERRNSLRVANANQSSGVGTNPKMAYNELSDHVMWINPELNGLATQEEEFSLCKCRITTGRTHQIRVHMQSIGHPLAADTKYLESKKCEEDRQWCPRMFLHAAVLEFNDPDSVAKETYKAVCPLADELVQALDTALTIVTDYGTLDDAYGIPPPRAKRKSTSSTGGRSTGSGGGGSSSSGPSAISSISSSNNKIPFNSRRTSDPPAPIIVSMSMSTHCRKGSASSSMSAGTGAGLSLGPVRRDSYASAVSSTSSAAPNPQIVATSDEGGSHRARFSDGSCKSSRADDGSPVVSPSTDSRIGQGDGIPHLHLPSNLGGEASPPSASSRGSNAHVQGRPPRRAPLNSESGSSIEGRLILSPASSEKSELGKRRGDKGGSDDEVGVVAGMASNGSTSSSLPLGHGPTAAGQPVPHHGMPSGTVASFSTLLTLASSTSSHSSSPLSAPQHLPLPCTPTPSQTSPDNAMSERDERYTQPLQGARQEGGDLLTSSSSHQLEPEEGSRLSGGSPLGLSRARPSQQNQVHSTMSPRRQQQTPFAPRPASITHHHGPQAPSFHGDLNVDGPDELLWGSTDHPTSPTAKNDQSTPKMSPYRGEGALVDGHEAFEATAPLPGLSAFQSGKWNLFAGTDSGDGGAGGASGMVGVPQLGGDRRARLAGEYMSGGDPSTWSLGAPRRPTPTHLQHQHHLNPSHPHQLQQPHTQQHGQHGVEIGAANRIASGGGEYVGCQSSPTARMQDCSNQQNLQIAHQAQPPPHLSRIHPHPAEGEPAQFHQGSIPPGMGGTSTGRCQPQQQYQHQHRQQSDATGSGGSQRPPTLGHSQYTHTPPQMPTFPESTSSSCSSSPLSPSQQPQVQQHQTHRLPPQHLHHQHTRQLRHSSSPHDETSHMPTWRDGAGSGGGGGTRQNQISNYSPYPTSLQSQPGQQQMRQEHLLHQGQFALPPVSQSQRHMHPGQQGGGGVTHHQGQPHVAQGHGQAEQSQQFDDFSQRGQPNQVKGEVNQGHQTSLAHQQQQQTQHHIQQQQYSHMYQQPQTQGEVTHAQSRYPHTIQMMGPGAGVGVSHLDNGDRGGGYPSEGETHLVYRTHRPPDGQSAGMQSRQLPLPPQQLSPESRHQIAEQLNDVGQTYHQSSPHHTMVNQRTSPDRQAQVQQLQPMRHGYSRGPQPQPGGAGLCGENLQNLPPGLPQPAQNQMMGEYPNANPHQQQHGSPPQPRRSVPTGAALNLSTAHPPAVRLPSPDGRDGGGQMGQQGLNRPQQNPHHTLRQADDRRESAEQTRDAYIFRRTYGVVCAASRRQGSPEFPTSERQGNVNYGQHEGPISNQQPPTQDGQILNMEMHRMMIPHTARQGESFGYSEGETSINQPQPTPNVGATYTPLPVHVHPSYQAHMSGASQAQETQKYDNGN